MSLRAMVARRRDWERIKKLVLAQANPVRRQMALELLRGPEGATRPATGWEMCR